MLSLRKPCPIIPKYTSLHRARKRVEKNRPRDGQRYPYFCSTCLYWHLAEAKVA